MSKIIPPFTAIRIVPRESDFLDRRTGSAGEIWYDKNNNTIRLYDGGPSGTSLAKSDLTNISNSAFLAKSIASGVTSSGSGNFSFFFAGDDSTARAVLSENTVLFLGGSGISTVTESDGSLIINNTSKNFRNIEIFGQPIVQANEIDDTLILEAGSNISLSTSGKTIVISADGISGGGNSFSTISVSGQSNLVADSSSDTLTLIAGTGINITTNAGSDAITISNTASVNQFSSLSDSTSANLTVDKIYLPAITMLTVTNNGASAYRFDQYGSVDDPTIFAINATTIAFNLQATGHPFLIQDNTGTNYNIGLIHVSTAGVVSTGSNAQGKDSGTLYWKIPDSISGSYRYQCSIHASMIGTITIKNFGSI